MAEFDGKAALVTGASKWIGCVIAERLAAEGCDVALVARDGNAVAAAAAEVNSRHGVRVVEVAADLATEEGWIAAGSDAVRLAGETITTSA